MTTSGLTKTSSILLSTLSKYLLNIDKLRALTTFLGSLFQCLTALNCGVQNCTEHSGEAAQPWTQKIISSLVLEAPGTLFALWATRACCGLTLSLMLKTTSCDSSHDISIGKLIIISEDLSLASCKLEEISNGYTTTSGNLQIKTSNNHGH